MAIAVFAYGSLVNRASTRTTLGESVGEPIAAELGGWRRRWSLGRDNLAAEKTFARTDDGTLPPHVLGLNAEPAPDATGDAVALINGALLEVDDQALGRLDLRELRYDRQEVSAAIAGAHPFDAVFLYTAKSENHAAEPPPGAVILGSYLSAVEAGFEALGPGQLARFRETTGPPPVEVVEATLVRERIPPGNPRAW
ncbi:MAG: hypothetical protein QOJ38_1589 [Solirubrobacterales bacterium]|jgi:hypothetical protein|nr:hypothetical protein [Solirubrobacterales bacterium]